MAKIGAEEKAFATTILTFFMHKIHFDTDFSNSVAKAIKDIDGFTAGDEVTWRLAFGLYFSPLIDSIADGVNKEREANG